MRPLQNRFPRLAAFATDLLCRRPLLRAIARIGPNLVVAQGMTPLGRVASSISRRVGARLVFMERDGRLLSNRWVEERRTYVNSFAQRADTVFVVGGPSAEVLRRNGVRNAVHLPNGVDYEQVNCSVEARPSDEQGRFVILWSGGLQPEKALAETIQAAARLASEGPVTLLAVGASGYVHHQTLPPTLRLRILPLIPQPSLFAMISWADVIAVPSWQEAWGNVAVEAMAAGRPVVVSTDSGVGAKVTHQVNGWVVPPRDIEALCGALRYIRDHHVEAENIASAGRTFAESLSWRNHALQLLSSRRELELEPD
ncbi:glycosyltransferase family 4 protein [Desertimonas flava]|uniref:glycosyltransferase family 4 protein n=1 Tax=Desertimonas flava TaxID=2064846 RepID=UPI00308409CD